MSLIGRQQHGEPLEAEAARKELTQWRQADPAHQSAFETACQYWDATRAGAFRSSVPLPHSRAERAASAQRNRRRALAALGIGSLAALLGGARWAWLQSDTQYALNTGHAQLLARNLPDGSHIDLGANTAGSVGYYRDRREVQLANGEMRFDVRPDKNRPFIVTTAWGRIAVLGTIFSVTVRDQRMRVEVAEGRVAVWAAHQDAGHRTDALPDRVLEASEAMEVDAQGFGDRTQVRAESVGAWREGWLVFSGTPLPEAIARWNDYLPQPLQLADSAALRKMRLTGTFPARDPQAFVQNLPGMLPVRIARQNGALVLYPRP
ncbi:FecR family protein [Bordetella sp. BOR01]|uniref:FecR family protein n=1 Tax=Bordetella sp. BOR01 TaxID=2854779 RepID=UPI001C447E9F|nr:FecR domain-containing protein [Bordetella sp. BOR01]MBV7486272.1 FecR domain-containing protein [Bordetella sp. BOR01]